MGWFVNLTEMSMLYGICTFDSESFELELDGRAGDTFRSSLVRTPSVILGEIRFRPMPTMSGLTSTAQQRRQHKKTDRHIFHARPHVTHHPRTAPRKSLYLLSSVPLVAKRVADIFEGSLADATRQPYHVAASSVKTEDGSVHARVRGSITRCVHSDYQVCTQRDHLLLGELGLERIEARGDGLEALLHVLSQHIDL